ncbi:MAG: hypothetical protein ACTSX7_01485 [Alphaproteobacteria bacterium]
MPTPTCPPLVPATVRKLRHHVESQARHIEIIERRLRQTMADAGLQSDTVERLPDLPRRPITQFQQRVWNKVAGEPETNPSHEAQVPDAGWWPRRDDAGPALTPTPGWNCYELANQTGKVLGISVFGLESQKLSEILALIANQQRKTRDFTPVFLTSSTAFHLFRRYGFVFEYLPPAARRENVAGQQNWHDYAAGRLEFVCRKWGINRIVCFGTQAIGAW